MKILRIKLENFRGHKNTELKFAGHHVLVGENGSGKTAVLEAINYATSSYYLSSRLDEQDFNSADEGDIKITVEFENPFAVKIPDGYTNQLVLAKSVELNVKRRERAAPGRAFSDAFVVSHLCPPIIFQKKADIAQLPMPNDVSADSLPNSVTTTNEGFSILRKSGTAMPVRKETISIANELIGFPGVFYFDRQRERETKTGFNSLFSKIAKDLNWRYRKGWSQEATTETWAAYYDSVIGVVEDKKNRELLTPLRESLREMLGDDFSSLEISLLNVEQPFSKGFLSFREGSNQVDLEGAGSGISMLAALLLLEQVSERSGDDLILLIDEPELHLHPQLQLQLAAHLQKSAAQTIVTTHSPLFVNLGDWRGIARMTGDQTYPKQKKLAQKLGQKSIAEHLDDISAYYYHETTFSSNDSELFFARNVLLVEGPVEKYGLPRLAQVLGHKFEQLTIISCNGKSKIPHYVTVCHAYELRTAVLFDLDGKDEKEVENAKVVEASGDTVMHKFKTSFEELLGIGNNVPHKASMALGKIDELKTKDAVPQEIQDTVAAIAKWCNNETT
jgi:predicted ATP-dependent endonuclease of OLD family